MSDLTFWKYMRKADQTEQVLSDIPTATLHNMAVLGNDKKTQGITNPKKIKAVVVDKKIVASVSRQYKLVQHKEAFDPIVKGLHQAGTNYDFAMFQTDTKAFLKVFVDEIPDNGSGIRLGFQATNSIDGRNAITYSLMSERIVKTVETVVRKFKEKVVDVWGFRQVCKNGMKIRVALKSHDEQRIVISQQKREQIDKLLSLATNIAHVGEVKEKIKAIQYVVEAMALLKEPVALIIMKAKDIEVGREQAKKLISKYIGKRLNQRILDQFGKEPQSLWGLYNAVTFVASHGVSVPTMNGLLEKSADLLDQEVFIKQKA